MDLRLRAAITLYAFTVLGLFLLLAPWSPVWEQAAVVLLPTAVGGWVLSGWGRGVVSGLGALDLAVAIQVAMEFKRSLRASKSEDLGS